MNEAVAPYLLAAEAYREKSKKRIISADFKRMLEQNVAQYSTCDAYLSHLSLLYVFKEFREEFLWRHRDACTMLIIMELVVLQITAINSMNRRILDKLNDPKGITLQEIHELYKFFANTMPLWAIRKFRYEVAQTFADKVSGAFKVNVLMQVYENNRKLLEDFERIKSSISSEKESKLLNFVAIALALLQILPLGYTISLYLLEEKAIQNNQLVAAFSTSVFVSLLFILVLLIFKRRTTKMK